MWIGAAITAYFFLALVSVVDKYLLTGPLPNPKLYAFAIGIFGGAVFLLIPFGFLVLPAWPLLVLAIGAGILQIFALIALFSGLKKYEASRIVPAIGGLLPVFTLLFTMSLGRTELAFSEAAAFLLLVGGSVLITLEQRNIFSLGSFVHAFRAALLFSLFVVLSKLVYEGVQPFFSALLLIMAGSFIASVMLLASGELRHAIGDLLQKRGKEKKTFSFSIFFLFVGNQGLGAVGFVLQNWAVALAPFAYVAFVNALEGVKYAFILLLASILSLQYPSILKEEITKSAIFQKVLAVLVIAAGLVLLAV